MTPVAAVDPRTPVAPVRPTFSLAHARVGRLTLATLLGVGAGVCAVGLLATSAWMISRASQHPSIAALGVAVVGVRFFALSRGLFRYGERLVGHDAAFRSLADVRVRVYERLERLAPAGLPAFRRGDLLTRLVRDVDQLQDLMIRVVPAFTVAALVGVAAVGMVALMLPAAGLVFAVASLLAMVAVPYLTHRLARRSEGRQAELRGELTLAIVDLVEGAPELVANGAVPAQLARVRAHDRALTGTAAAAARTAGVGTGVITLLTGLAVWGAAVVGIPAVAAGRLDGTLLAVIVLTPLALFELVLPLPGATQAFEQVRRSATRVLEVVDAPDPVLDAPSPRELPTGPHHLVLRGVSARYAPGRPLALDAVDLDLAPGRRVAIVGPSGAGKSTLARVLLRFLPYETGLATLDGVGLADLRGADVRRVIGLAEQDAHVFDTTLRENLLIGDRAATDAALHVALGRARLSSWIDELPLGLDTPVGEHGARLSGGQRQRLTLARAFLADFPVLVLDEPGEHLDTATGDALTADVVAATTGHTTILITHRLAGLAAMDEVLVLDGGRVVQRGRHAELVAVDGWYARQWQREQGVGEIVTRAAGRYR